jgi:hypothetical protein
MNTCAHIHREVVFQFYNVNSKDYFPYFIGGDVLGHWIQFQTRNYQNRHAEFYSENSGL